MPYYFGNSFIMPYDRMCYSFKEDIFYKKIKLFNTTLECLNKPLDQYICDVYVKPMSKIYTDVCSNTKTDIYKIQKESLCNSFNGCLKLNINNCYRDYRFCYNEETIPHIRFNKNYNISINECKEKVKKRKYTRIEKEILLILILLLINNIYHLILRP